MLFHNQTPQLAEMLSFGVASETRLMQIGRSQPWVLIVVLSVLALALFFVVRQLGRRYPILRVLRIDQFLRRVPWLAPYVTRGRQMKSQVSAVQGRSNQIQRALGQGKSSKNSAAPRWWPWGRNEEPEDDEPDAARDGRQPIMQMHYVTPASSDPSQPLQGRYPVSAEFTFDPTTLVTLDDSELIGRRIGRYQIEARLSSHDADARAGQAFQAFDLKLKRPVALKLFSPDDFDDAHTASWLSTVQTVSTLDHPHIVRMFDYEAADGYLYMVHDFVSGLPLNRYLEHMQVQRQQIPLSRLLRIAAEIADALRYAERQEIRHGGLRASRILLEMDPTAGGGSDSAEFSVRVTDFGLDALTNELTPDLWNVTAPERFEDGVIGPKSDIYMLGALLYEWVTGQPPFEVVSLESAQLQHVSKQPTPPSRLRQGLPLSVEQVILTAMAKSPDARFEHAGAMAQVLHDLAQSLSNSAEERPLLAGDALLTISGAGVDSRTMVLDRARYFIGSAEDNDIVLGGRGVSEHHARIERAGTGWLITDLRSETGTFVEGAQLLPELVEIWSTDSTAVIGAYFLSWQEVEEEREEATVSGPDQQAVGVSLLPSGLRIAPGKFGDIQIALVNNALHVDHFFIEVSGIPPEWVQISNNNLQLLPGAQGIVLLNIAPPRDSSAGAAVYAGEVHVTPVAYPHLAAKVPTEIEILPYEDLRIELLPELLRRSPKCQLVISNFGNKDANGVISGRDSADSVTFKNWPPHFHVPSGTAVELPLTVEPSRRHWIGRNEMAPFSVLVQSSAEKQPVSANAQLEIKPRIPMWVLTALSALMMLAVFAGVFYADRIDRRRQTDRLIALFAADEPAPEPTSPPPAAGSCNDILALNGTMLEGDYTIHLNRNPLQPVRVFCAAEGTAAIEYLRLPFVQNNFTATSFGNTTSTATYSMVRLILDDLSLDPTDQRYVTVSGIVPASLNNLDATRAFDFGTATGCRDEAFPDAVGTASVNLTGTPFVLSEQLVFDVSGENATGEAAVSGDRRSAELSATGSCGTIRPTSRILIRYAPREVGQ